MTYKLILVDPDDLEKPLPLADALRGFRSAYSNIHVDEAVEDLTRILIPEENSLSLFANHDQVWTSFHSQSHVEAVARAAHKLGRVVLGQAGERWEYDPASNAVSEGEFYSKMEAIRRTREAMLPPLGVKFWVNQILLVGGILLAAYHRDAVYRSLDAVWSFVEDIFG